MSLHDAARDVSRGLMKLADALRGSAQAEAETCDNLAERLSRAAFDCSEEGPLDDLFEAAGEASRALNELAEDLADEELHADAGAAEAMVRYLNQAVNESLAETQPIDPLGDLDKG